MPTFFAEVREQEAFADDPVASHSAQFGLGRPDSVEASMDQPSPAGVRPWNLRGAQSLPGRRLRVGPWRYDYDSQVAVDPHGQPIAGPIGIGEPTAESASHLDGDEGPSEDWTYDFVPDNPGSPF